jgi:hypothetical protein
VIELRFLEDDIRLDAISLQMLLGAIADSFDTAGLRLVVRLSLNMDLDAIVSPRENKLNIIYELVKYAEAKQVLRRLVAKMKERNPGGRINEVYFVESVW